jgi:hypothetical protein
VRSCVRTSIGETEFEGAEGVLKPLFDLVHELVLRLTLSGKMFKRIPQAHRFTALFFRWAELCTLNFRVRRL